MNPLASPWRPFVCGMAILAVWGLSACTPRSSARPTETTSVPAVGLQPVASIQELMQAIVDPTADALWESVSSTVTAKGTEDKVPQTDSDWRQLRHLALTLAEAGNLLAQPGRTVTHAGQTLEDAHVKDNLTAADIERRITADPAAFAQHALALQAAANQTLQAIETRDVEAFMRAGSQLDRACEGCHQRYWYPNDKRPTQ